MNNDENSGRDEELAEARILIDKQQRQIEVLQKHIEDNHSAEVIRDSYILMTTAKTIAIPVLVADNYAGLDVHRAARIASAGHGGQVLLSQTLKELVFYTLPAEVTLNYMGEHRLKDLRRAEHLYQLVLPDLPAEFPPLKTLDNYHHNLPVEPTPLIGRDDIVRAVSELLSQERTKLITLIGPGGIGKTRLALQIAAELVGFFKDGVYFVELDTVTDPQRVPLTIAQTLGLSENQGQSSEQLLKNDLAGKQMLLVLDNFEQVISAAPLVARIQALRTHAGIKVLVTSRIPLHIRSEREYPIPPLALPEVVGQINSVNVNTLLQYPAVTLFIFQYLGDLQRATKLSEECLVMARQVGHLTYTASALNNLGMLAVVRGDSSRAVMFYEEALSLSQQAKNQQGILVILGNLGVIARQKGELDKALSLLKRSLKLAKELGFLPTVVSRLEMIADVLGAMGEGEQMARLLGATSTAYRLLDIPAPSLGLEETKQIINSVKEVIGEKNWEIAFSAGSAVALDTIVKETL